jgi:hypothetical protein
MPTLDKARAPPNCCFQFVVGIIRKSACCLLCRARHNRHTFASRLVMSGVGLRDVQELMGHKTIAMTCRYAHVAPSHQLEAVRKLDVGTETSGV